MLVAEYIAKFEEICANTDVYVWRIVQGQLRCDLQDDHSFDHTITPVDVVFDHVVGNELQGIRRGGRYTAAREMGLSHEDGEAAVDASLGFQGYDRSIRKALIGASGVQLTLIQHIKEWLGNPNWAQPINYRFYRLRHGFGD